MKRLNDVQRALLDNRHTLQRMLETSEQLQQQKDYDSAKVMLDFALSYITSHSRWQWSHEVDVDYFIKTETRVSCTSPPAT
eukprot:16423071-Heterocapsa_arctica.AAC.1